MPQECVVATRDCDGDIVNMHRTRFPPVKMTEDEEMWMEVGDGSYLWLKEKEWFPTQLRLGSFAIVLRRDVPQSVISFLHPTP